MTRFAACLALACALAGCTKPASPPKPQEKMEPAVKATADEMLAEYKKNEVGADLMYKDKLIQVTGTVAAVKKDIIGRYFVGIGSPSDGDMYDVMCYLDDEAKEAAGKLKIGDKATLMGLCAGRPGGLVLTLKSCVFAK